MTWIPELSLFSNMDSQDSKLWVIACWRPRDVRIRSSASCVLCMASGLYSSPPRAFFYLHDFQDAGSPKRVWIALCDFTYQKGRPWPWVWGLFVHQLRTHPVPMIPASCIRHLQVSSCFFNSWQTFAQGILNQLPFVWRFDYSFIMGWCVCQFSGLWRYPKPPYHCILTTWCFSSSFVCCHFLNSWWKHDINDRNSVTVENPQRNEYAAVHLVLETLVDSAWEFLVVWGQDRFTGTPV